MTTRPKHDVASIATDASRVHDVALDDLDQKAFAARIDKHELAVLAANIAKLKLGAAAQTTKLTAQVAAGAHTAQIRAALAEVCRDVRDTAQLDLAAEDDAARSLQHAFGLGVTLNETSTSSVEHFGHLLLAAAQQHPTAAHRVHLDKQGMHHLSDLLHALEGADTAHVKTQAQRHTATTALDSLAHLVSAEAAHIRFVAKRVFRTDPDRLTRYASTLPRHQVQHRTRLAPEPAPA
jgi:hypothetical protein